MQRVLLTVLAATLGFLVYGLAIDSPFVNYYVPVTLALIGAIALIHRSVGFATATLWALAGIAIGNLAGGVILINGVPLYEAELIGAWKYDKFYHAAATAVGAWASYEALRRWSNSRRPALIFGAIMMASGAGALVEIVEYIGTLVRDNTNVGDYDNNMQDLIANTVGAVGAAFAAHRWQRPSGR